MGKIGVHLW